MSERRDIKSICLVTRDGELQHIHDESDMVYSFGEHFLEITTSVRKFLISVDTIASINIEYGETVGGYYPKPERSDEKTTPESWLEKENPNWCCDRAKNGFVCGCAERIGDETSPLTLRAKDAFNEFRRHEMDKNRCAMPVWDALTDSAKLRWRDKAKNEAEQ